MAAGIPIVPIVIRNAELVAARNSTIINPGTVDVAVFPPISVDDWTLDTLPERIAEVRQLYLDTLADWPVDELPEVDIYAREKGGGQGARKTAAAQGPARRPRKRHRRRRPQPRKPRRRRRPRPKDSGQGKQRLRRPRLKKTTAKKPPPRTKP